MRPRRTGSRPARPYAAAKAAGELLVGSYVVTHGIDAVVTRGSNTYGPYHHPEKLIPLFITNALDDQPLPLYGDGLQRREWLYVGDHAAGIDHVLRHGVSGETYNVAGGSERTNREVVTLLLDLLGKPWSLVMQVEDRPGHDRRYAMDGDKVAALGWRPRTTFEDGLAQTVEWYRANETWWRAARSGDWDGWYARQYAGRLATGQAASPDGRRRRSSQSRLMRVAVTGAGGPPRAAPIVAALADAPFTGAAGPIAWARDAFDLDAPEGIGLRLDRDRPEVVVHAAAWTDVDGCALDPELALRRNAVATGVLAAACAARGTDLLVDLDQRGVRRRPPRWPSRTCRPIRSHPGNPYGASKAEGERLAATAFASDQPRRGALGIARTAWLFGSPGRDFPSRILDAAERASAAGEPLRVVSDEWGTPTYTADVAEAIVELLAEDATGGIHHLVNGAVRDAVPVGALRRRPRGSRRRARGRALPRPGPGRHGRRAGACSRRHRCRPASRCARGRTRWPTTPPALLRASRAARSRA